MIEVHTVAGHPFKDDDRDVDQNGDWSRRLLPVECNVCVLRPKQESQLKSNPKAVCLRDNVADVEADVSSSSSQSIALSSLSSRLLKGTETFTTRSQASFPQLPLSFPSSSLTHLPLLCFLLLKSVPHFTFPWLFLPFLCLLLLPPDSSSRRPGIEAGKGRYEAAG